MEDDLAGGSAGGGEVSSRFAIPRRSPALDVALSRFLPPDAGIAAYPRGGG